MAAEFQPNRRERKIKAQNARDLHREMFHAGATSRGLSVPIAKDNNDEIFLRATFEEDDEFHLPQGIRNTIHAIYPEDLPIFVTAINITENDAFINFDLREDADNQLDFPQVGISLSEFRNYDAVFGENEEKPHTQATDTISLGVFETVFQRKRSAWRSDGGFFVAPATSDLAGCAITNSVVFDFETEQIDIVVLDNVAGDKDDCLAETVPQSFPPQVITEFTELMINLLDEPGTILGISIDGPPKNN